MTMGTTLNWGRLYSQGRCKAIGVSWTDEENKAVFEKGIPAEYVRLGILDYKDYLERKAKDDSMTEKPLIHREKEELLKMVHEEGIEATSDASKETLVLMLENKKQIIKEQKEKEKIEGDKQKELDKNKEDNQKKAEANAKAGKTAVKTTPPKAEKNSENKPSK